MNVKNILECDTDLMFISGSQELELHGISILPNVSENSLLFVGHKKFLKSLEEANLKNTCVIISAGLFDDLSDQVKKSHNVSLITCEDVKYSMTKISRAFYDYKFEKVNNIIDGRKVGNVEIHPSVDLGENVFIGERVKIGAGSTIYPGATILSDVEIGENTVIYPNVSLMTFSKIGNSCRIHSGTTIGSDGFGYHFKNGEHHKIWHFGGVVIEDNVEIGANCSIDQGTFSPTFIQSGVKIDNLVQIAHNVNVAPGVILCGQVGLAGSSEVGAFSVLGGKAGLADGKKIGQASQVAGAGMVLSDIGEGSKVGGHPARPLNEWLKGVAFLRRAIKEKNKE